MSPLSTAEQWADVLCQVTEILTARAWSWSYDEAGGLQVHRDLFVDPAHPGAAS